LIHSDCLHLNPISKNYMESKGATEALFLYAMKDILAVNNSGKIMRINSRLSGRVSHHREKHGLHENAHSMTVGMDLHGLKKNRVKFSMESHFFSIVSLEFKTSLTISLNHNLSYSSYPQ
jgi:hypothetical protein